jgi:hypothetical protein
MRWAMIRVCLAACGLMGAYGEAAWGGTLLARDGKTYTGKVEFKAGNQVVVTPARGEAVTLLLENVAKVTMADAPAAPGEAIERDPNLPLPWQQRDIGRVKAPGSGAEDKGVFTVRGAGWGIWGGADSFHFVYQPFGGDIDVVAQLGDRPTEENAFVAGLTMRESLDASAAQASVMMFPGGGVRMSCRPVQGGAEAAPQPGVKPYQWVRLARTGDRFSGFCSADGQTWVLVGTVRVKMGAGAYVGLACATTLNHAVLGTTFDHVKLTAQAMGPAEGFGLVDGSLMAGRVKRLDEQVLKYADGAGVERSLPARAVAHVFTRALPADARQALAQRKEGISLASGDEIEGAVQGMGDGRVTVASLLFGRQSEPLAKVVMVVLRPAKATGGCAVSTRDGSIYRGTKLTAGEGMVTAEGGAAGTVNVKAEDITGMDLKHELQ